MFVVGRQIHLPEQQLQHAEEDRKEGRNGEPADTGGEADPDRRKHVDRVAAVLEVVPEADPRDDTGQAEGQGKAVLDHDQDRGNHDGQHDHRLHQRLVVLEPVAGAHVGECHRQRQQEGTDHRRGASQERRQTAEQRGQETLGHIAPCGIGVHERVGIRWSAPGQQCPLHVVGQDDESRHDHKGCSVIDRKPTEGRPTDLPRSGLDAQTRGESFDIRGDRHRDASRNQPFGCNRWAKPNAPRENSRAQPLDVHGRRAVRGTGNVPASHQTRRLAVRRPLILFRGSHCE